MPTRRPATATDRSAPSRAVVKKAAPVGPDCALVLSAASRAGYGALVLGPVVCPGG